VERITVGHESIPEPGGSFLVLATLALSAGFGDRGDEGVVFLSIMANRLIERSTKHASRSKLVEIE